MRIGIDARFYGTTGKGLGRYTEKLIAELERLDQENDYVIFLSRENFEAYLPSSPRFRKVLAWPRWYTLSEQLFLPFLLRRERLDLVHFPHFNVPLLYRRPFLFTLHDLILFHFPTLRASSRSRALYWLKFAAYRLVLSSALTRAREVIAVSRFTEADILSHFPWVKPKLSVTYEAAEASCRAGTETEKHALFERAGLLRPENEGSARGILPSYVLYVGNAYPHKNLELLLELAARLPGERFALVGKEDYFYTRLKREAERRRLRNVFFLGALSEHDLGMLYRSATVYLFPSLYEGFGLPPLEAMNYGVPVLSSSRGSLPEILGNAAWYFDPGNPDEAEALLRELLKNAPARASLREAGYRQASRYSWREMAEATLRLYERARREEGERGA